MRMRVRQRAPIFGGDTNWIILRNRSILSYSHCRANASTHGAMQAQRVQQV